MAPTEGETMTAASRFLQIMNMKYVEECGRGSNNDYFETVAVIQNTAA